METKLIVGLVAITLIVAVVGTLATMSLTGNIVIKQGYGTQVTVTTNQEVLSMLTVGGNGKCRFESVPYGENMWNPSNDDYVEVTVPFMNADANKDGLTTGAEYAKVFSSSSRCIYGFKHNQIKTGDGIITYVMEGPVGCFGGSSYDSLKEGKSYYSYLFCRA